MEMAQNFLRQHNADRVANGGDFHCCRHEILLV
jgi:hypothetical protein